MPYVSAADGVRLYYEEAGSGTAIVFVHEFAGDYRSWENQVRYFSRSHRCITFSARGYLPSDVPEDPESYSQDLARDDIGAVMDGLDIDKAHINGLSMGGFATLHFGLSYPDRCLSLVVAGCGYGAEPGKQEQFKQESAEAARRIMDETMASFGKLYALGPTRVQHQNKDPRGWQEFADQLCEHSSLGSANTQRGVQGRRPSLYDLQDRMRELTVPTLILNGDEDEPCLDPGLLMKRCIRSSALVMLPRTGHCSNLEEPALYNLFCSDFMARVEAGAWGLRDPRSITSAIIMTPEDQGFSPK